MFPTDYAISAVDLGRAAEEHGFESLWLPEHTHIPASRRTPWPGGADLPQEYWHTLDPFVALGAVAAVTSTLRLGFGVCLVVERDPIVTAKEVASLDHLSGGRVLFGVGGGWNLEEMANHGTTPGARWKLLRERVEAMKAIWTQTKPEYHGEFVNFDPMMAWPQSVQQPHPPVIVGGAFPHGARRAARYGDGWIPLAGRPGYGDVFETVPKFREMLKEAGRDAGSCPVSVFSAPENADTLKRYRDLGIVRVAITLAPEKESVVLPILDRWVALIRQTG